MDTFFRIFGIYPLQRIGKEELKATPKCRFWFRYVFTTVWVQIAMAMPMGFIFYNEATPREYIGSFVTSLAATSIDKITFVVTFLTQPLLQYTCLKHLEKVKKCMMNLQHDFNTKVKIDIEDENPLKFYSILSIWLILEVGILLSGFPGMFYKMQSQLSLSFVATNVALLGMTLLQVLLLTTPFYFIFVYLESTINISNYCRSIKKQSNGVILQESKLLLQALKEFNKMSGPFLFWIISRDFIFEIVMGFFIYVKTNTLLFDGPTPWQDWLIYFSFVLFFIRTIFLLFIFCTLSEDVVSEVQELKTKVIDMELQNGQTNSIIQKLDEFKGFTAYGYFTLNQSLLTGMTTNFATFLVILIQFKQAEGI